MKLRVKRVYAQVCDGDGKRILVDRLWPRGLSKEKAAVDLWLKEIGPSGELRRWFSHDAHKWEEFKRRYEVELAANTGVVEQLRQELESGIVTLLYGSHDETYNNAVALAEFLRRSP